MQTAFLFVLSSLTLFSMNQMFDGLWLFSKTEELRQEDGVRIQYHAVGFCSWILKSGLGALIQLRVLGLELRIEN